MRLDNGKVLYAELFVLLVMLLAYCEGTSFIIFLSEQISIVGLAFYLLAFAYLIAYAYWNCAGMGARGTSHCSLALHAMFMGAVAVFLLPFALGTQMYPDILLKSAYTFESFGVFFAVFIPLFFLTFVAAYLARQRKDYRHALLLFIVAFLVLLILFSAKFLVKGFIADDEEFLAAQSVHAMLSGANPYAMNLAGLIYDNSSVVVPSMTATNRIIGTMVYPALFFLTFVPFYFASPLTLQNIGGIDLPLQAAVFAFALLAVFAFTVNKEDLFKPRVTLLALFVVVLVYYVSSITTYLMLALMLLAYAKIDSKYAWIPLGLCLSIQEELWLPMLFLLVYSLNRHGARRAALNALGAAAVFLAFNAYFIALGPATYVGAIFSPLSKMLLPITPSPIGLLLMSAFPVQLQTYSAVFVLAAALLLLVFMYRSRKELIPLFGFLPLLVLPHLLPAYYILFLFFALFAVCTAEGKRRSLGVAEAFLRKRKPVLACAIVIVVACTALVLLSSHAAYERNFNISLQGQSLYPLAGTNSTAYNASIRYSDLENDTVYMMVIAHAGFSSGIFGLLNDTIIVPAPTPACAAYECYVNTNRIVLSQNGTQALVSALLPQLNGTDVDYADVVLYNGEYVYLGASLRSAGR